jgi:hypothetical protein
MGNFTESTGRAIRPSIAGRADRRGAIVRQIEQARMLVTRWKNSTTEAAWRI